MNPLLRDLIPGRSRSFRVAAAAGLVGLVASFSAGCRAVHPESSGSKSESPTASSPGDVDNPTAVKNDFRKDVSPEQAFNVHLELGKVYEGQSNFESAISEYQKAIDIGDKKGNALIGAKLGPAQRALAERRMGGAFDRLGRFTQAEAHYRKALELAPKDAKVWNDVGYSYYLQNRLTDAERALKTAQSFDPNDNRVLTNLGLTLAAAGRSDEALQVLSKAGGPAIGEANLGFILAAQGKMDEARIHYQQALGLQPELTAARNALTQLDRQTAKAAAATTELASAAPPPAVSPTAPPTARPATVTPPAISTMPPLPPSMAAVAPRRGPASPIDRKVAPVRALPPTSGESMPPLPPIPTVRPSGPLSRATTAAPVSAVRVGSAVLGKRNPQPEKPGRPPVAPFSASSSPKLASIGMEDLPELPPVILNPPSGPPSNRVAATLVDPQLQRASFTPALPKPAARPSTTATVAPERTGKPVSPATTATRGPGEGSRPRMTAIPSNPPPATPW